MTKCLTTTMENDERGSGRVVLLWFYPGTDVVRLETNRGETRLISLNTNKDKKGALVEYT
jgi:hypothetical protein